MYVYLCKTLGIKGKYIAFKVNWNVWGAESWQRQAETLRKNLAGLEKLKKNQFYVY